ncbi:MAG: transcriptional regulator TbsP [Halobacteriaceae archaeon]
METNLLGLDREELLTRVLEDATGPVLVVNPAPAVVEATVAAGAALAGDHPTIRVLADESTLKTVFADFIQASRAADLVESGHLSLRTSESLPQNAVVVTDDAVVALVTADENVGGLVASDAPFVDEAVGTYTDDWEAADEYGLRTPAISTVRSTMDDELGPDVTHDFDGVLASLETARGDDDDLDEVTVSLLVAARNEELLYDVSKWGEDVGIASKATFSRTKTRLEDRGIIDTEKVPIEVGRPRLRLKLADERLQEADPADLASVAQSVLAS